MKKFERKSHSAVAPVKFRSMVLRFLAVTALFAVPLLLVWKQAFITSASQRLEKMNDTLSSMDRNIAALRFARDRLSRNDRIEGIAQTSLGLEYPASDRIIVVPLEENRFPRHKDHGLRAVFAAVQEWMKRGGG
jgi:cell division protein FtsL